VGKLKELMSPFLEADRDKDFAKVDSELGKIGAFREEELAHWFNLCRSILEKRKRWYNLFRDNTGLKKPICLEDYKFVDKEKEGFGKLDIIGNVGDVGIYEQEESEKPFFRGLCDNAYEEGSKLVLFNFSGFGYVPRETKCSINLHVGQVNLEGNLRGEVSVLDGAINVSYRGNSGVGLKKTKMPRTTVCVRGMLQGEREGKVIYYPRHVSVERVDLGNILWLDMVSGRINLSSLS
jgi:hypothetical protein